MGCHFQSSKPVSLVSAFIHRAANCGHFWIRTAKVMPCSGAPWQVRFAVPQWASDKADRQVPAENAENGLQPADLALGRNFHVFCTQQTQIQETAFVVQFVAKMRMI
eukprot:2426291-Rhodomonas_salina.2